MNSGGHRTDVKGIVQSVDDYSFHYWYEAEALCLTDSPVRSIHDLHSHRTERCLLVTRRGGAPPRRRDQLWMPARRDVDLGQTL